MKIFIKQAQRKFLSVALIMMMILSLGACQTTNSSKNELEATNTDLKTNVSDDPKSAFATTKDGVKGGKVIIAASQEPDSLNPLLAVAAGTKEMLSSIYEGLMSVDKSAKYVDCLAKSHEVKDNGKTWIFTLNDDVHFHSGKVLDSNDVVFSYQQVLDKHKELKNIVEVKALDKLTVEFNLQVADPDFPIAALLPIVPADSANLDKQPDGTGPFKFVSYVPQESLNLSAFTDYRLGAPNLAAVTFRIVSNNDAQWLEFKSGNIDIFPNLTVDKTLDLQDAHVESGLQNMLQVLALNNADPILKDQKVRAAIDYAIDRQKLAQLLSGDYANPCAVALSGTLQQYQLNEHQPAYDLAKAKELLKAAGYENGFELHVKVPANYSFHVQTAQVLAAQLQAVGIKVQIEPLEWTTWLDKVYKGRDYQATIIALPEPLSPAKSLERLLSDNKRNFFNYQNKEFDELWHELATNADEAARIKLAKDIQTLLANDHASAYLQDIRNIVAVSNKLTGYQVYPAYIQDLYHVQYIDAQAAEQSLNR